MSPQSISDEQQAVRRHLAVQRGVELDMNRMIRDMKNLVDESGVVRSRMEKNQFSNLLAVTLETPSVELVKNWILYQVGRDSKGNSWRSRNFGQDLVTRLDNLREQAESIAGDAQRSLGLDRPAEADIEAVWIEMVRRYVGQLNRYFCYKKESSKKEDQR